MILKDLLEVAENNHITVYDGYHKYVFNNKVATDYQIEFKDFIETASVCRINAGAYGLDVYTYECYQTKEDLQKLIRQMAESSLDIER